MHETHLIRIQKRLDSFSKFFILQFVQGGQLPLLVPIAIGKDDLDSSSSSPNISPASP
jgi:hypothetical protein